MESLKVGVVGLGLMGERHARVFDKMPLVGLYSLCDTNEVLCRDLGNRYGAKCYASLDEMLDDPELDAIDIALPDNMHLKAIELAVKKRKHIFVEKPMACLLSEAERIYELTEHYEKTFMIGHILRFDPRYAGARDAVQNGRLGDLVSLYARRNSPVTGPLHYKGVTDLSMHVMVHDIDAVQWISDSRIVSVYAKASNRVLGKYQMTDCIHALATFENGMTGCLEACWILPVGMPGQIDDKLELIGTKGVLYTDSCDHGMMIVDEHGAAAPDSRHWPDINGGVSGALYEELTAFINCILRNEKSIITPYDGLTSIQVVDAIKRSIIECREVHVRQ